MAMSVEEAMARADSDMQASKIIDQLRVSAGDSFAGGWIDAGKAYVGVTDQSLVDAVTAAGANPVLMANSLSKLEKDKDAIDHVFVPVSTSSTDADARSGIASYYVDVVANKVIIEALADSRDKAQELASKAGVAAQDVEVRTVDKLPTVFRQQS